MLSPAQLAQDHWNATPLYVSPEERYRTYPWLPEAAEFAGHSGQKVLEVGCGTGCDLLQFARNGALAYGIDITDEHLRLARQRVAERADVRFGDGRSIPFPDSTFDYVYSHGVIHHSNEPKKIVAEILRVLKPGGRFNVHVYAKVSYFTALTMLKHGQDWKQHIENSTGPVHIELYTARMCKRLFAPAAVTIEKRHCKPFQFLSPLFGWYLIVRGRS
jgi:ubiquinone/menaquinone biosynthesis C-methylase UbiE